MAICLRTRLLNKGHWHAVGAYGIWGLFPIYWKLLHHVPPAQLLCHRIIWSFVLLIGVVLSWGQWGLFTRAIQKPRVLRLYVLAAGLVSLNWLLYVWAVNAGFIVETSLGYFINPLLSVLIGVVFLGERLRPWQWVPVGLAASGILYLTISYGSPPWIALTLAFTWAIYGLVKKVAPLGSLHGLTLETGILFAPVLFYLVYVDRTGHSAFLHGNASTSLLLIGSGLVTTIPLWLFASAVQRIPLSIVGILQYIAPTLQFLIGVLVYKEPFTPARCIGFGLVWTALVVFAMEGYLTRRVTPTPVEPD
jgi:chloramphenicol-sensitive protein RarD